MSTAAGSPSPNDLEKTKQQIRGLVQEISQLSRSDMPPDQYYAEVLNRVVTALAAHGGAVWTIDEDRRLRLDYQININSTLVDTENPDSHKHFRLLQEVIKGGEPRLVPPMAGSGEPDGASNPTNTLLVLAPMTTDDSVEGVLEVFQRGDAQPGSQQGYLRFLVQMSQHVGDWLKGRKLKTFSDRQSFWAKINNFSKDVHDSLDVGETAYTIANEGRRLIECDRCVVTTTKAGGKQVVQAVSGQDTIDPRSNIVTYLQAVASRVCATGEALWYTGKLDDLPPQVEQALEAYIDESHTKSLAIVPLRKADMIKQKSTDELGTDETVKYQSNVGEVIGSLIIEQVDSTQSRELVAPRIEEICQQSARALGNAIEHNELFLMPVWRTIGKSRALTTAKNLPKTLLISGLILATLLGLIILSKDFELKADGQLMPVTRRNVFFTEEGKVTEIKVKHGQMVKKGDPLIILENHVLKSQIAETQKNYDAVAAQIDQVYRTVRDRRQPSQQAGLFELVEKKNHLAGELERLRTREKELTVVSPIDGQIMTSKLEDLLSDRPVGAGQQALQVADPTGEWELEIYLAGKRMGHFSNEYAKDPKVKVSYILKSNPNAKLTGTVKAFDRDSRMHEEFGHGHRIEVDLDEEELRQAIATAEKVGANVEVKQGTEVIAKVKCGRASMAYCFFHELYEWLQMTMFSI